MLKNLYEEKRSILREILPIDLPLCISIEPTNLCNFKCTMCFHGNNETDEAAKPLKNMGMEIFEKTLSDIKDWCTKVGKRVKLIKLYSLGEPLLNPSISMMLKRIKETEIADEVEITTNGSLLKREIAERFVDDGLDIIRFSIYGIDPDENERITRSTISPEVIKEQIGYLQNYRDRRGQQIPKIYIKMFDKGETENRRFMNNYRDIADVIGIDAVFNMDVGGGRDVFENMYGEYGGVMHEKSLGGGNVSGRRACRYPFTHLTIRNDGTVIMCCADWLKELSIGNVLQNSLQELWESRSMYELRCKMLDTRGQGFKACRSCEIPYRDLPEDDISDFSKDRLSYRYEV